MNSLVLAPPGADQATGAVSIDLSKPDEPDLATFAVDKTGLITVGSRPILGTAPLG